MHVDLHMAGLLIPFVGAEWWAQDFQKSVPLLGWVPFIAGIDATMLMIFFCICIYTPSGLVNEVV